MNTSVLLINTNTMKPPIGPIALDYLATALEDGGFAPHILDLAFEPDAAEALRRSFRESNPGLVGLTFRNADDSLWPSGKTFVPRLAAVVRQIRALTTAPIVIGGNGFSLFPREICAATGADFGICGDGEESLPMLARLVADGGRLDSVPGLADAGRAPDRPARCDMRSSRPRRRFVDNARYFREGGQGGVETKRGCDGACVYCADVVSKGADPRLRNPAYVCDEIESLLAQGIDTLHLCDSEFNRPMSHALSVCREMAARRLGEKVRWYAYASITPFSAELAEAMRRAGCAGINFGADSSNEKMLRSYGRSHRKEDIASVVSLCRANGITVMLDLLFGGPGETAGTVRETIEFMKGISPDCVGAALGVRVYPGTEFARRVAAEIERGGDSSLRRLRDPELDELGVADGDLLRPAFYISRELGEQPARLVCDIIGGDKRFFEPMDEQATANYNYNDNQPLVDAIRNGARGAYWDILRKMR